MTQGRLRRLVELWGDVATGACRRRGMIVAMALAMIPPAGAMTLQEVFKQPEQQQRKTFEDTVGRWFLAADFADIEDFANTARQKNLRTSSGLWVIGLVYSGVDSIANKHQAKDDKAWDRLEAIAKQWIGAYPESATAKIVYGSILQNRAWFYRGDGYANTVSDAQFAAFYKQIEKTKQYQLTIRKLASVDPNWYTEFMATLRVEKAGRHEEFEQTFADAIRAFPDYYPNYFEAVTYYLPKWKGDALEVEHFARRVMKSRDRRTGRMLYARIYWYTSQSQFKDAIFLISVAHWNDMREGFKALVADYPDQWNINHYAKFACLVGDQDTTREAFDMMRGDFIKAAWESTKQFEKCQFFAGRTST